MIRKATIKDLQNMNTVRFRFRTMDFSIANRFSENDRFHIAISQVDILAGSDVDDVEVDP